MWGLLPSLSIDKPKTNTNGAIAENGFKGESMEID